MSARRRPCPECRESVGHKPVCPLSAESQATAILRSKATPLPPTAARVVTHLNAALMESSGIPCRTPGCDPALMETDIDSEGVCDTCRAHWLMESAREAAERYAKLADDFGFADEAKH